MEHFDLDAGTSSVTIEVDDPSKGSVVVNTLTVPEASWTGTYFKDVPPRLTAVSAEGFRFVAWSGAIESTDETIDLPLEADNVGVTAVFE